MKKQTVIDYLGNAPEIAQKLGYAHRNVVYSWPGKLTDRVYQDIKRRMRYENIPIPKTWK